MKKNIQIFLKSFLIAILNILLAGTITYFIFEYLVCDYFSWLQFIGIFGCIEMIVNFISVNKRT